MTEEERQEILEEMSRKLETEHERRLMAFETRRRRSQERKTGKKSGHPDSEKQQLWDEARLKFYKDHGYQKYVDSRGNVRWLLPEEYEYRMKRHRRRSKRHRTWFNTMTTRKQRRVLLLVLMITAAIGTGLFVLRQHL